MDVYVVRLNPDTRGDRPYSKYPTQAEYDHIHKSSPMDGFHEAVNFLPEKGVVRGYLPPRHLKALKTGKPFVLVTITAKTAKVKGDMIIGIQAGCQYEGEIIRKGGMPSTRALGLVWHYSCPDSLSLLFDEPIANARKIVLNGERSWIYGPTYKITSAALNRILKRAESAVISQEGRKRLSNILDLVRKPNSIQRVELDVESSFEDEVAKALNEELNDVVGNENPKQREVMTYQYDRDPRVVAYVLKKADGICHDCRENGPFISKTTGLPYLEVHHIKPLGNGGTDMIDNAIALCPNCHRKRHFG